MSDKLKNNITFIVGKHKHFMIIDLANNFYVLKTISLSFI